MPAPTTIPEFVDLVQKSQVLDNGRLSAYLERLRGGDALPAEPNRLAGLMVRDGILTHFQAEQFLQGRWKRFTIGRYKVLERIGSGGMGHVFLCEHKIMRRRVAVKVLPMAKVEDKDKGKSSLQRFYREARAVAALDHPNIVRAYDIDQDDKLHFLVMEYVDGKSFQEIVKAHGPMAIRPACHYIQQSAVGLQYASDAAGLVHRDIKPGNILVDRQGVVKILDMGLARFFHDTDDNLTRMNDDQVLGTADYLSPEQAVESHSVDVRADIYSLGATFYFLLTGRPPFADGTITQKLIWHQKKPPRPVRELRPDVPPELAAVIARMMAKQPSERYQQPIEVAEALAPWTAEPLGPPPTEWMPHLSLAAQGSGAPKGADTNGQAERTALLTGPRTPVPRTPRPGPLAGSSETVVPVRRPTHATPPRGSPRPAPPPQPANLPAPEVPPPVWESLTIDTPRPTPAAPTAPLPPRTPLRQRLLPFVGRWRRWLMGVGAVALVVLLGIGTWWLIHRGKTGPGGPAPVGLPNHAQGEARTLMVSASGKLGPYRTILQAYLDARSGDQIVVTDDVHEEALSLDHTALNATKEVTIAPPPGRRTIWRAPATARKWLIYLNGCSGLHVRGFDFEGDGLETILYATGHCEGLTLEDLEMRGYSASAIRLANCEGSADHSVSLDRLRIRQGTAPAGAVRPMEALALSASPTVMDVPATRFVLVKDCELEGAQAVVRFEGTFADVTFTGNRLSLGKVGLLFEAVDLPPLSLKKATFGALTVVNNQFLGVPTPARVDAKRTFAFDPKSAPVQSSGNTFDGQPSQGNLRIE